MIGQRRELPNRRAHDLRDFEIFISCSKPGSAADETAPDAAIIVSIGLQHGARPQTLAHSAMRDDDGNPTTAVGFALDLLHRGAAP